MSDRDEAARGDDALEREWERLWYEIRRLLPRCQRLFALGRARTDAEDLELRELEARIAALRVRTRRYREVLRSEAIAGVRTRRDLAIRPGPTCH